METADFLALKEKYKPKKIEILFISDGKPVNNRYFYLKNSSMYRAVKEAFTIAFGEFSSDDEFLKAFVELGAYFESLTLEPIKYLPPHEQKAAREQGVKPLAERIAQMKPRLIIISIKAIEKYAREAISLSGVPVEHVAVTPFPVKSMANVNNCINGIIAALKMVDWEA